MGTELELRAIADYMKISYTVFFPESLVVCANYDNPNSTKRIFLEFSNFNHFNSLNRKMIVYKKKTTSSRILNPLNTRTKNEKKHKIKTESKLEDQNMNQISLIKGINKEKFVDVSNTDKKKVSKSRKSKNEIDCRNDDCNKLKKTFIIAL